MPRMRIHLSFSFCILSSNPFPESPDAVTTDDDILSDAAGIQVYCKLTVKVGMNLRNCSSFDNKLLVDSEKMVRLQNSFQRVEAVINHIPVVVVAKKVGRTFPGIKKTNVGGISIKFNKNRAGDKPESFQHELLFF